MKRRDFSFGLMAGLSSSALGLYSMPAYTQTRNFDTLESESLAARLNQVSTNAIDEKKIVGSVILVAHRGEVIYQKAMGMADRESGKHMTEDAIFLLASVTKPLVSVAAMRLVEEGKIGLNDPVTKWLPQFKPQLPDGSRPEITIWHLLTHTSGLSYGFFEPHGAGPYHQKNVSDGFDMLGVSLEENLHRLMQVPLLFSPGTSWGYSLGLDVLGGVMAVATREALPQIVKSRVTEPLGLSDTGFHITDRSRLVTHYKDGISQPVPMDENATLQLPESWGSGIVRFAPERIFDPASYPSAGAGMAGTATEFMHFLLNLTRKKDVLLSASSVKQMMDLQVSSQSQTQGPGWGFGYGWAVLDNPQLAATPQSKGTIQWGGIYGHNWFFDPQKDIAMVALTNTTIEGMAGMYPQQIRNAVYGVK